MILTVEELDELPVGSIVIDQDGRAHQKRLRPVAASDGTLLHWTLEVRWWMASWRNVSSESDHLAAVGVILIHSPRETGTT